jgi:Fic family protein
MRVKIFGVEMTIPNKLLDKLDVLDFDKLSDDEKELFNSVNKLITKGKVIISDEESNKRKNAKKATTAKVTKTREKIQNAINLLKLQGEEINPYRISKLANVSYNTARKYFSLFLEKN